MTYWALNAIFLGAVAILILISVLRHRAPRWPAVALTMAVLLVMTAVFDKVMIGIGLVAYEPTLISGAFIGIAPLEDFAYAIAAVLALPALWTLLGRTDSRHIDLPESHEGRYDATEREAGR